MDKVAIDVSTGTSAGGDGGAQGEPADITNLSAEELASLEDKGDGGGTQPPDVAQQLAALTELVEANEKKFEARTEEIYKNNQRITSKKDREIQELREELGSLKRSPDTSVSDIAAIEAELATQRAARNAAYDSSDFADAANIGDTISSLQIKHERAKESERTRLASQSESDMKKQVGDTVISEDYKAMVFLNKGVQPSETDLDAILEYQRTNRYPSISTAFLAMSREKALADGTVWKEKYESLAEKIKKAKAERSSVVNDDFMVSAVRSVSSDKGGQKTFKEVTKDMADPDKGKAMLRDVGIKA